MSMFEQMFLPSQPDKEREKRKSHSHLPRYALLATLATFSQDAHAWADFQNEPNMSDREIDRVLQGVNLPNIEELEHVRVFIPRISEEGRYIVHIAQQHAGYGIVEETESDREETVDIQKKIYQTIRSVAKHYPYVTYYPEGMTQGDNGELWNNQKKVLQQVILNTHRAIEKATSPGETIDVKRIFDSACASLENDEDLSRSMMHIISFHIQKILKDKKVPSSQYDESFLEKRNPFGDLTEYYYGAEEKAFHEGFIQNVRGCENEEMLRSLRKKYEAGVSIGDISMEERE